MSFVSRPITTTMMVLLLLAGMAEPGMAHSGEGIAGGFLSGLLHPWFGLDHLIAMVAVGLWGAFLGPPALWLLPVTFPLIMAFGGVLGILDVSLPQVENGIALSAVVLGLVVALALKPPLWVAAAIVAVFAIFHGHAHGAELPSAANPLAYSAGFVISTGLLHLAGVAIGLVAGSSTGRLAVRGCGALIATAGLYFLIA